MIILIKKEEDVKADLQNMIKHGTKVKKLMFNYDDFFGKNDILQKPKSKLLFLTSQFFLQGKLPNILAKVCFIMVFIPLIMPAFHWFFFKKF